LAITALLSPALTQLKFFSTDNPLSTHVHPSVPSAFPSAHFPTVGVENHDLRKSNTHRKVGMTK
jgi:hypothetical protein